MSNLLSKLDPLARSILGQTRQGILLCNASGNIEYINQAALELLLHTGPAEPLHLKDISSVNLKRELVRAELAAGNDDAVSRPSENPLEWELVLQHGSIKRYLSLQIQSVVQEGERFRLVFLDDVTRVRGMESLMGASTQSGIITRDPAMLAIVRLVEQVAPTDATVLLQGESGTGKGLVAQMLHRLSQRAGKPFVELNCAAIPEALMEAELFGHVKGAFTGATSDRTGRFAAADGGTLFLDEIGELPLHLQAKLLRVLQDMRFEAVGSDKTVKVNVRLISASNRNLRKAVNDRTFRADLYYRLSVIPIHILPLRERKGDIPHLIQHIIGNLAQRGYPDDLQIEPDALHCLVDHPWPGNIRELQNCIEHAVICATSGRIMVDSLPHDLRHKAVEQSVLAGRNGVATTVEVERARILLALERAHGSRLAAANLLGMDRSTLWRKMQRLGISEALPLRPARRHVPHHP